MRLNLKLREKLLLSFITTLMICFAIFGSFRIYQAKISITEDINRSGREKVALLAETLTNLILAYDYGNIELIAERIIELQDVHSIRILNRSGKTMAFRKSANADTQMHNLEFSSAVTFSGENIGTVVMELSLDRIDNSISEIYRNIILVILMFVLLLSTVLYLAASRIIIKPLLHLSHAADQMAAGNFEAKLPPESSDELGRLVQSFAAMRESRRQTEAELNNLNTSLESIVLARVSELQASEQYNHAILDNVSEGIIVIDENEQIETLNSAAEKIFGYSSQEIINQPFSLLVSTDHLNISGKFRKFDTELRPEDIYGIAREMIGMRRNHTAFPLELKTTRLHIQNRQIYIITARDISDRKDAEERIRYMASHDTLTGLPNRTLLQDRIQQTLLHNSRRDLLAAVLFIDLDKFKIINDTLGHDAGDSLLQEAASRLISCIRSEDTVARQGGDEFIILLSNIKQAQDAAIIAQKLLDSLTRPFLIKEQELHISASIGIAISPHDGHNMETLLKNSDTAMYHAKESGRSNYQFFSSRMNELAAEKQSLSNELRHAIDRNELSLEYQPISDVITNEMTSMEVLLRWNHPLYGSVSPSKFIPMAEEIGIILPIGEWVMHTTCSQIRAWLDAGFKVPRIAINLSARQFRQKNLTEYIRSILKNHDIPPAQLGIEITESMLVENVDEVVESLLSISNMGLEISIDDFGTGYSSLNYLKRFPINKLKIDKSFVDDITTHEHDESIVKAIIDMAHGLKLTVVAEGVETLAQLDRIRQQGGEQYQGYLNSRPLPASKVEALLTNTRPSGL